MSKFKSSLTLGFTLINNGVEYFMEEGTQVTVTVAGPYKDEVISGVIAGCSIKAIKSPNRMGRIFDGIPTQHFHTDDKANIKNVVDVFEVDELLINTAAAEDEAPVYREVSVAAIKAIDGQFVSPDGSVTVTVDPAVTPISEVLAGVAAEDAKTTLVLAEAEVSEELSIAAAVSVHGVNAGIAQNHNQEV